MKITNILIILVSLALVAGCGLSNTMYNARNYFKSAQERPLNSNGRPNPQAVEEYTKAIQKCGIIIQERKNGKQLEEALFLMAQSLYFKGNSAFQAKDQFENLIRLFPQSKYIPDAYIFLAKVYRDINQAQEAENRLGNFIRDPNFVDYHPKALLVLADFEIKDKDYYRAQYWLEKLINEYPETPEYREAIFLMGKNYYAQKDYQSSLNQFELLLNIRRLDKNLKLEAQYYLALNRFELGRFPDGLRIINSVISNETRPEKLALAKVLKGRLLISSGEYTDGSQILDAVIREYPRSASSSAAAYYLGDYYFYIKSDNAGATTNYNRVRSELSTGEYVNTAQLKTAALQQLTQGANLNSETNLQQFLDYHYLAADNYFKQLSLPDSSLMMYDRVLLEYTKLDTLKTSLETRLVVRQAEVDSLRSLNIMPSDSTLVDSTLVYSSLTRTELNERVGRLNSEIQQLQNRLSNLRTSITKYQEEIIPFVYFVKASLRMKLNQKEPYVSEILETATRDYPLNKYTNAIRSLYNGQRVRVIDPRVEAAEARLDYALGLVDSQPDSMLIILNELLDTPSDDIKIKSRFRLGWYYAIEKADTLNARPHLEALLDFTSTGKYGDWTRKIFNGRKYILEWDNPYIAEVDSLMSESDVLQDSILEVELPVFSDSLAVPIDSGDEPMPEDQDSPNQTNVPSSDAYIPETPINPNPLLEEAPLE